MAAPHTNNGKKSEKSWRDAIVRAVNRESKGKGSPKRLEVMAEKVAKLGMKGEGWAVKEIGDRMDGKPAQALQIKGDPDSPVIFNLRLGDGLTPKTIDHVPDDPTEPLVAITYQDEESQPE